MKIVVRGRMQIATRFIEGTQYVARYETLYPGPSEKRRNEITLSTLPCFLLIFACFIGNGLYAFDTLAATSFLH